MRHDAAIVPRLLDRAQAAAYLGISPDTIDRLIHTSQISVVRLPVERSRRTGRTGRGVPGTSRRILIDRAELDELIPRWRERAEPVQTKSPKTPARVRARETDDDATPSYHHDNR